MLIHGKVCNYTGHCKCAQYVEKYSIKSPERQARSDIKTRNAVINAAVEMGYKSYKIAATTNISLEQKRFVILSSRLLMSINYHSYILKGIESSLVDYDVELVQIRITDPASFKKFMRYLDDYTVDGIICIEFFDTEYIEKLSATGKPLVFMDFPVNSFTLKGHYDLILPENMNTIQNFCLHLIQKKAAGPSDLWETIFTALHSMNGLHVCVRLCSLRDFRSIFSILSHTAIQSLMIPPRLRKHLIHCPDFRTVLWRLMTQ